MLAHMVRKSVVKNIRTSVWIMVALACCGALVTLFSTIALEIEGKVSADLRRLGANAVIYPAIHATSAAEGLGRAGTSWPVVEEVARRQFANLVHLSLRVGLVQGKPVAVVSASPEGLREMTPYWAVTGRRATAPGECVVGRRLADALGLKVGTLVGVQWDQGGRKLSLRTVGILDSGDEDEARLFVTSSVPEEAAFHYALLSVPGGAAGIGQLQEAIRAKGVEVRLKPLYRILHGEESVLKKINLLSGVTLVVVVVLTSLGVSAAALARVAERRRELALLLALGAKRRSMVVFLLAESSALGAMASVVGFAAGTALAEGVAQEVFHASVSPQWAAMVASLLVTMFVSVLSSAFGCGRAVRIQVAAALRGE
ncbi:MAG: ABC transporter permease [Deltaproteobacteria bacterium]|nr:ABC transporter permease [Deltaproteobacteria bacterium]